MPIRIINDQNFISGMLFLVLGLIATGLASHHTLGNAMRMGPGYFPLLLGGSLVFLGSIQLIRCLKLKKDTSDSWWSGLRWRPSLFVGAGVVAFALLAQEQGLLLAIAVLTLISGLAQRGVYFLELLALSIGLALFGVAVFSFGLGLPLPVLPAGISGAI